MPARRRNIASPASRSPGSQVKDALSATPAPKRRRPSRVVDLRLEKNARGAPPRGAFLTGEDETLRPMQLLDRRAALPTKGRASMRPLMRATRPATLAARLVFALALGALGLMTVGAVGALASKTQWSIFEDHPHLVQTDPQTREQTLDEIQQLGADTLRVEVKWNEVAPKPNLRR